MLQHVPLAAVDKVSSPDTSGVGGIYFRRKRRNFMFFRPSAYC